MKRLLIGLLLLFLFKLMPLSAQDHIPEPGDLYIVKYEVNFRDVYSTKKGKVLYRLKPGDILEVEDHREDPDNGIIWIKAVNKKDGKVGWAAMQINEKEHIELMHKHSFFCSYLMFSGVEITDYFVQQLASSPKCNNKYIQYIIKDIAYIDVYDLPDIKILTNKSIGDNCVAIRYKDQKIIVVNEAFFSKISNNYTNLDPLYVILAHELAHHKNDHMRSVYRQDKKEELVADELSGKIIKSLGYWKPTEFEQCIKFLGNFKHGGTHPKLEERQLTIRNSWISASNRDTPQMIRLKYTRTGRYDHVSEFKNGFAIVKKDGRYGYINKLGREIIPVKYLQADYFNASGIAKVKLQSGDQVTIDIYDTKQN